MSAATTASAPGRGAVDGRRAGRPRLADLGIGARLAALAGVLLLVLIVVGVGDLNAETSLRNVSQNLYTNSIVHPSHLQAARVQLLDARLAFAVVAADVASHRDAAAAIEVLRQADAGIDPGIADYKTTLDPTSAADAIARNAMADFDTNLGLWRQQRDALLGAAAKNDGAATNAALTAAAAPGDKMDADIQTSADSEASQAKAAAANAASKASGDRTRSIVLLALGALLGAGLAVAIACSVTRPVRRAVEVLDAVGSGDFTRRMGLDSRDEMGRMSASIDLLVERLGGVLRGIGHEADTLRSSSDELSTIAAQIAANAEETSNQSATVSAAAGQVSANVTTVAAATEEMLASIVEIARSAGDAAEVAASGASEAEETNAVVGQLSQASGEIGDVARLIASIAEQTNLLALNATIEAARAGEAGKGFAVVAGEVKDLAKQTGDATAQITSRISAIQSSTAEAVTAIGRIRDVVGRINETQTTIASAVEEQTATANEIGRSVAEAATGASEIARNITDVATAADDVAEGTTRSQTAAGRLVEVSGELQRLIGQFRY